MIKKTIHFNNETLNELDRLISILGIEGYGDIPKALKFSVTFTRKHLERYAKVLPNLNLIENELLIPSIKRIQHRNLLLEKAKILKKQAESNTNNKDKGATL